MATIYSSIYDLMTVVALSTVATQLVRSGRSQYLSNKPSHVGVTDLSTARSTARVRLHKPAHISSLHRFTIMGSILSSSRRRQGSGAGQCNAGASLSEEFVTVTNEPKDTLVYDPRGSYMISFGIDQQYSENYKDHSIGDVVKLTALDVTLAFVENGVVPQDNIQVYVSSEQKDECTLEGMKHQIRKQANNVSETGLLVIFLSGRGVKFSFRRDDDSAVNKWGFAPCDYNQNSCSTLYPDTLFSCLQECKAKYIFFVLDCCYAGPMAMELTDQRELEPLVKRTFVLAATTAGDISLAINSLGYSIFSYFLRYSLDRVQPTPGCLPLADVFMECRLCTEALSSIIIRYDHKYGLKFGRFTPSFASYNPQTAMDNVPSEETIISRSGSTTAFVWKYYQPRKDKTKPPSVLNRITTDWLESLHTLEPCPLQILEERDLLEGGYDTEGRILMAVITLLIHSIASIELVYNNDNVTNPNLFLLAFVEVMAALDRTHRYISVTPRHLLESLPYYMEALVKKQLDCSQMADLYRKVAKDICSVQLDSVDDVEVS